MPSLKKKSTLVAAKPSPVVMPARVGTCIRKYHCESCPKAKAWPICPIKRG